MCRVHSGREHASQSALADGGSLVGWGDQVWGKDLGSGFSSIAAGGAQSLALKPDGSVVAWGDNYYGQCDVPAPNSDFVALAAGSHHILGLKANGTIAA